MLRSKNTNSGRGSPKTTSATRIGLQTYRLEPNRILLFVYFNAVPIADASSYRQQICDPSVTFWTGGSSVITNEKLVHVRRSVPAPIGARDNGISGAHAHPAFRHAEPFTDFRKRGLRGIY